MSEKLLECMTCPECGKTPILVVRKPLPDFIYAPTGSKIRVTSVEACDQCFERFLKLRGSSGHGFYFT